MKLTSIVKNALIISGGISLIGLSACNGVKDKLDKICKEDYKWTEQECATAFTEGLKMNYMLNIAKDAKDGGRKFEINYNALSLDEILDREKALVAAYESNLDPKNIKNSSFFEKVGTRNLLIEELLVHEQRVKWMTLAKTLRKFVETMGYNDSSIGHNYNSDDTNIENKNIDYFNSKLNYKSLVQKNTRDKDTKKQAYNLRFVSPFEKLDPVELFSVAAIEAARKKGKLEIVQSFRFPFYEQVQRQDPKKPNDQNAKIWKYELRGVEVIAYDVDGDEKKLPDYITVSKMNGKFENGKAIFDEPSSKPSIQIFKAPGSQSPDVLVVDGDGDLFPDDVSKIFGVSNASDLLFSKKDETIGQLFPMGKAREEKLDGFRKGYQLPEQSFDAAIVGQSRAEEFKINNAGWPLPTFRYKNEKGNNYVVEIVWEMPKVKGSDSRRIELFRKVYHASGNEYQKVEGDVVEYFKPPREYAEEDIRTASVGGKEKQVISINRRGKTNEEWHIDDILRNSAPFAIEYNQGDKREIIMDRNGEEESASRYEAKKLFTPKEKKVEAEYHSSEGSH